MRINLLSCKYTVIGTLCTLYALAVGSCAKQGYPSGGPVDKQPPVVKGVSPASETTNFNAKRFRIDFDEYVTMKDADNNVLISPPMSAKPEYTTKGHSLIVKLSDTLTPNTTYLFQFKNAIVDFNEGNPLPSFDYVFSTGNTVDSMTISGTVTDALTQQAPEATLTVMAYEATSIPDSIGDSIVAKLSPAYQTRTASDGSFRFNYIRPGQYKVVAIDDADKNLRYATSEAIAWLDSPIRAYKMPKKRTDTVANDTLQATLPPDTVLQTDDSAIVEQQISLTLSLKEVAKQRVLSKQFVKRGLIQITTQLPLQNPTISADSVTWELSDKRDTLNLWTLRQARDSVNIILSDSATSLNDTIILKYREPKKSKHKSDTPEQNMNKVESLTASSHPFFDTILIRFETPVKEIFLDSIPLMLLDDSTTTYAKLLFLPNHNAAYQHVYFTVASILPYSTLKQGGKYRFTLPPKICRDIYNRYNDSLTVTTTITKSEDYGSITIELKPPYDAPLTLPNINQAMLQLLGDKDAVIREIAIEEMSQYHNQTISVTIPNLKPATYRIRLFYDLNGDRTWTPGDYYLHRQPEPVVYFKKSLQLRANWEMNETWEL